MTAQAPATLSALQLIEEGLDEVATTRFAGRPRYLRARCTVIESDPGLGERELRKQKLLTEAVQLGFLDRGVDELTSAVAAHIAAIGEQSAGWARLLQALRREPVNDEAVVEFDPLDAIEFEDCCRLNRFATRAYMFRCCHPAHHPPGLSVPPPHLWSGRNERVNHEHIGSEAAIGSLGCEADQVNGQTGEAGLPDEPTGAHLGHRSRQDGTGEHRVPPAVAVIVAAVLYALLPGPLLLGPRLLIPGLEVVLLIALVATNPWRLTRQTRISRLASVTLSIMIAAGNFAALGLLVHELLNSSVASGGSLLLAALQVWVTNVIAFGLIYWEIDRGGPVARTQLPREQIPLADIRFSHDEDRDTIIEVSKGSSARADWMPTLIDYLYLSVTNSSAFGPTDTMPLSSRLKILMAAQATAALLTSLLVIARAVGTLK